MPKYWHCDPYFVGGYNNKIHLHECTAKCDGDKEEDILPFNW